MAKPKNDDRQEHLVQLTLEELNHEKALLKRKMRETGKQLSALRKEAGEHNAAYEEIDKEMLRRDETFRQLELDARNE